MAKTVPLTCARCGATFTRFPSRAKRYARQFCSAACSLAEKKTARVGCVNRLGYRQVSIDCRTVLEHRLVAEKALGRPLLPNEVVHHINGKRADNRPENLRVIENSAAHLREHGEERWVLAEGAFLHRAGVTFRQIGEVLCVKPSTVFKRLRDNGLVVPTVRKGLTRNRDKTPEEIAALRAEFAASEIA